MPTVPKTADPFNNYVKGKDQSQMAKGNVLPMFKPSETDMAIAMSTMHSMGRIAFDIAPIAQKQSYKPGEAQTPIDNPDYEDDERNFRLGEDSDKESFVKKYGVDHAIERLDDELDKMKGSTSKGGEKDYIEELKTWRNRLDERRKPSGKEWGV